MRLRNIITWFLHKKSLQYSTVQSFINVRCQCNQLNKIKIVGQYNIETRNTEIYKFYQSL